ncbi:MAG: adenylate/guanylate cyclase domain-containing protein [Pseudomonadota bacterium]
MEDSNPQRRLAAIMLADVAGFSTRMERDESGTFARMLQLRERIIAPQLAAHEGRLIKLTGDGFLAEFASATAALRCAIAIQQRNLADPAPQAADRLSLRIGINLGDIISDGQDIAGDGVNIAARLEALAPTDGICVSAAVKDQVHGQFDVQFEDGGEVHLKNIARSVHTYTIPAAALPPLLAAPVSMPAPPARAPRRRMLALALGACALAAICAGLLLLRQQAVPAAARVAELAPSIAVLPFVDMSQNRDQEYFSDGISEELLNLLAHVPQLRVIARTSSFSFKGKSVEIADIARKLDVAFVLEGSVRRANHKFRITAQLIRAADSAHLWSETYDRSDEDVFKVQDEIAAAVVDRLKLSLLGASAPKSTPIDPQAHALILQANFEARRESQDTNTLAISLYRRALAIAPRANEAWNGLAAVHLNQARYSNWSPGSGPQSNDEALRAARDAAEHAVANDALDAHAHSLLGMASLSDSDIASAAKHLRQAISLDARDPAVRRDVVRFLITSGRLEQAYVLAKDNTRQDPANPDAYNNVAVACYYSSRWQESIDAMRAALALMPQTTGPAHFRIATALMMKGDSQAGLRELEADHSERWRTFGLGVIHAHDGRTDEAERAIDILKAKYERDMAYNIAVVYGVMGKADATFEWLDKAYAYHDTGLGGVANSPMFAPVKQDRRWLPFLRKVGMAPEQLAAISFDYPPKP